MRRVLVEGFAGGGIKSKQLPCESTSSPAQNHEKNNALWLTRSCFRLNMFRYCYTIFVSFVLFAVQQCAQRKTSVLKLLHLSVSRITRSLKEGAQNISQKKITRE